MSGKIQPTRPPWDIPNIEPKRGYKFILKFGDIPAWIIKTASRPQFTVGQASYKFLQHEFKFPGQVTWNDISVGLIDRLDVDASQMIIDAITAAGYAVPGKFTESKGSPNFFKRTIDKGGFTSHNLSQIIIETLDMNGSVVETWTLHNAWIKSASFGDLSYDDEKIIEYKVDIVYDWAELWTAAPIG